jgi:hypothetical protein
MSEPLYLRTAIYSKQSILTAINAYRALATITLLESDNYYICNFANCKYDEKITKKEFANFLIDCDNSKE